MGINHVALQNRVPRAIDAKRDTLAWGWMIVSKRSVGTLVRGVISGLRLLLRIRCRLQNNIPHAVLTTLTAWITPQLDPIFLCRHPETRGLGKPAMARTLADCEDRVEYVHAIAAGAQNQNVFHKTAVAVGLGRKERQAECAAASFTGTALAQIHRWS